MTFEEEYNKLFRKYGTRPPMDEVFEIYNQTSLDKQKVKDVIDKYHGGIHPICNMCKIKKELGL